MSGRFDELRRQVLDNQGAQLRLYSDLLHALDRADEENRRLRDEVETVNLVVYTEEEAAERLRMSQDTLARLRTSEALPHFRAGVLVRYTNKHLAEITEMLAVRRDAGGRKHLRKAG